MRDIEVAGNDVSLLGTGEAGEATGARVGMMVTSDTSLVPSIFSSSSLSLSSDFSFSISLTLKDLRANTLNNSGCSFLEEVTWLDIELARSISGALSDTKGFRNTTRSTVESGVVPSTFESESIISTFPLDGETSLSDPLLN